MAQSSQSAIAVTPVEIVQLAKGSPELCGAIRLTACYGAFGMWLTVVRNN